MIKGPPEFSKKSWRPPWFFSAASHLYLWSEKSPPENTKAMKSAPLNLLMHFLSPPENEKAKLMPPWILRRKTERRIHPKTAIFNRPIQGGLAHQKCYARVQPGHSVVCECLWWHLLSKIKWGPWPCYRRRRNQLRPKVFPRVLPLPQPPRASLFRWTPACQVFRAECTKALCSSCGVRRSTTGTACQCF